MLIKTKYIDCASKSVFNTWKLPTSAADTSGDIYWSAVVYIKDTGEVWTHGKLYGGFFSNADNNKVSLTIGGTTKILALDGHVQSYTTLTGSGSIANQAILSTGEANKWTLKTLGKNAFSNVDYLPADATAVAAEKVVHALAFQYNGKAIHSFDGSVARVLNIIQGDNVFITGDSQGNVTIAADPGSDTVNTAGATNKVDTKLFLIGAESQTTAPQTYSNQYVYIGTDNCLYSLGKKVLTEHQAIYNLDLQTQVGEAVTKVTTFDPNAANNSFTLVQGTNVTLTPDAANKKVTISSKDTTYDFYNLVFKQGESVIDTYKPTTSPSKTLKAGTNVTFTGSNNEVLITTQDTRNTAGATEKLTTKLFLTGVLTQTDNPQTYTNSKVYIGADNKLYSDGKVVSTGDHTHNYAGATSPGGPALKVDLNPSGLLDATYGSYGGILQDSNKGPVSGSWSNRIKILHNNSTGYYTELAQNFTGTAGLWHRRNVAGTVSEWTPVIDNANFHTYLDSTYVIRGNDPNVLTNYVRYSIASGLTMNWEWGNATPTHIWGAKASDSSKAYVFNGDNIRAFANAVNRAGDTMTGTLKVTEIQATNGNGLVMWNGTTYTYLGMQAGTTYIRSGETDLQHRYNGTDYKIWDARNLVGLRTEHSHNTINFIDSRETASTPQEHAAGVWLDFKANAKANLSDGGNYTGLLTVRKYGGTTDWSGGKSAQLGFTDNSNVWVRFGTGTSWEAWKQLATTGWADGKFLPLAGGTVTGNIILKGSTNADMTNANIHPRLRFDNSDSSQTVSFIFTDYDSYRAPAGIKLVGNQGNEWFEAPKLIKTGSSDSYVLLGGGGHKALAQFVYAAGNLGVQESTGTSDNISRAQFWRDNNLGAYGVTLSHSDNAGYKTKIYHDYGSGGNLYMKACSNGTWGSVYTIWNSGNFDPNTKVNKAGDIMTGPLVIASTVNNQYNEGLRISLAANNWAGITFGSTGTSGAPSNGWFAARNPSNQFIISPGDSSSSTGLTLNKGGNLLWRNRNVLLKDEINSQVGGSKSAQMNWASWGTDNYGGAIQIREKGLVTNTQSAWGYSPALSFHWGNRYAKRFGMRSDGQFAVDDVPISLSTHTHNYVKDISNGTNTTFAYSKAGMNYADFTWLAGWNGYELRAVNKSLFAQASHTHDYIPRVRIQNPSNSSTRVGVVPFNVLGLKTGYPMTADPEFASGNGLVSLYNNAGNGATVIERISDSSAANTTGYVMRIRNTGAASPGLGGFHSSINSRANAVFVQIFRAKIPTGHSVVQASNSMGSSYGDVWITDTAGTGKWEWYGRIIYCGESGSFSSGGHVYLNGNAGTSSSPLYWYISYCQVYDLTKGRYDGLRCRYADEVTNADTVDGQHASAFSYKSWWHWSGQSGQPTWLWGGNSENAYYVYNPSNFRVAYATSAGNADTVDGYHSSYFHRNHRTDVSNLNAALTSDTVTFDYNNPTGGPGGWINGFASTHSNYLSSYIVNVHRSHNWYLGWNDSKDSINASWVKIWHSGNLSPVPIGGIILWSGSVASIPSGWALCNGSNGTPDLRNRFVVGAGSTYRPGNTGGLDKVTLSLAEMPSHFHQIGVIVAKWGDNSNNRNFPDFNSTSYPNSDYGGDIARWRTRYQGGSTNYTSAGSSNGRTRGTTTAHENRPPYYALAYIMRIS